LTYEAIWLLVLWILIFRSISFIKIHEFLGESIDLRVQLVFAAFYYFTSLVPVNQFTFFKRFFIGTGIGLLNLAFLALVLRRDIQQYRKAIADRV